MHILFLTWKDIRHSAHGGAEVVVYNYAKRLVSLGHTVTWFASSFQDSKSEEVIDGIQIIRRYSMHTIWIFAWSWYRRFRKSNHIDVIIDEAGGWPLLSPLYEKNIPLYFLVHHIGESEFRRYGFLGALIKKAYRYMIGCYRNCRTITVSNSTKEELVREFSFNEKNITVIENACDIVPVESIDFDAKKNKILFLGRLMPIKRAEDTIHAFSVFYRSNTRFSDYSLDIIGNNQDKEYFRKLQGLVQDLSLENSVHFLGQKDKESLSKILLEYKVILVPSMKEGFGLIVLEANSYGIPALGYNVSGLRDSIVDGENGFLISDGSYTEMGENLSELCSNIDLYKKLSIQSLTRAKNHPNWDINTQALLAIISQK